MTDDHRGRDPADSQHAASEHVLVPGERLLLDGELFGDVPEHAQCHDQRHHLRTAVAHGVDDQQRGGESGRKREKRGAQHVEVRSGALAARVNRAAQEDSVNLESPAFTLAAENSRGIR